jgi:hypothetical protein
MDFESFPSLFRSYRWNKKHALYGYPPDEYRDFRWIASLEQRFEWLRANHAHGADGAPHLIKEMIQWGGSQNGVLQKFEDQAGAVNIQLVLADVIGKLGEPAAALESALSLPGLGLTYASKLLRFLDPIRYGALDGRIREASKLPALGVALPLIYDGNVRSMVKGYVAFLGILQGIRAQLAERGITRPACALGDEGDGGWRAADVEMALFQLAAAQGE